MHERRLVGLTTPVRDRPRIAGRSDCGRVRYFFIQMMGHDESVSAEAAAARAGSDVDDSVYRSSHGENSMRYLRGSAGCGLVGGLAFSGAVAGQGAALSPFTEEALLRGLVYETKDTGPGSVLAYGWGIGIADLNGNGHQDVVLTGAPGGVVGFFMNDGAGFFTDESFMPGDEGKDGLKMVPKVIAKFPSGVAIADYNGNGMLDIYLTQRKSPFNIGQPNLLLRNEGNFRFIDVAEEALVANKGFSEGAAWGDVDNNGWLDLYVANFTLPSEFFQAFPEFHNKLFQNLGNGTFADVGADQEVDDRGLGFSAAFTDTNRNGWLDLYLANDRGNEPVFPRNRFWRNEQGTFVNACDTSQACLGLAAMCVGVGDFVGNGFPDLYVTNIPNPIGYNGWNPLLVNHGDGSFSEHCTDAGVCHEIISWAGIFFDCSNNGWLDLYVCNQYTDNHLYVNEGVWPVQDHAAELAVGGTPGASYNAAVGDLTGNGALDILMNDAGSNWGTRNVQLYINHEGAKRNWIRFSVVGEGANHHAIGANIEVVAGGHIQWREIYAGGNNFKAQNELVHHFGLGDAEVADQIRVEWPGGSTQRVLSGYPAQHTWTIYPASKLGNFNGAGAIGVFDLLALLETWGPVTPGYEMMDLNGDGAVNVFDLLLLLDRWGT